MGFLSDKFTDALFIFVGIFAAFYFDQYQENQTLKKELDFNLGQLIYDLPEEDPESNFPPYEYEQTIGEDGKCDMNTFWINYNVSGMGAKYLDLIKERGLVRFMKDKRVIRFLSFYYDELVPKASEARDEFSEQYQIILAKYRESLKTPDNGCFSKNDIDRMNKDISVYYQKHLMAQGYAQMIGHSIYKDLLKIGVAPPVRSKTSFSYKLSIDEKYKTDEQKK